MTVPIDLVFKNQNEMKMTLRKIVG